MLMLDLVNMLKQCGFGKYLPEKEMINKWNRDWLIVVSRILLATARSLFAPV